MRRRRKNCHLNCLICHLSGASCVYFLVPGPGALLVFRATMNFLNVSSVPVCEVFSLPLRHSLFFQQCARGLLPNQIPLLHAVSASWSLSRRQSTTFRCQDLEQGGLCKRVISVIRCSERCGATRSTCVSRDIKIQNIKSYMARLPSLA